MKRLLILIIAIVLLAGCSADDPAYTNVVEGNLAEDSEIIIRGVTNDGTYQPLRLDTTSHAIETIDIAHSEIHSGNSYIVNVVSHDLDDTATLDLTVITANTTKWMHIVWAAEGTLAIHIYLYENSITNVAGAVLTPINRDRNSSNTPGGTFRDGDTFTNTGNLLWEWHTGDRKVTGGVGERDEFILKQGAQYLFRIESEAADNKVSGIVSFYELTNKGE